MTSTLLESLTGLVTPQLVSQVAGRVGESESVVARGLTGGLTSILAALAGRAGDTNVVRQLYDLVAGADGAGLGDSPASIVDQAGRPGTPLAGLSGGLMSLAFGSGRGAQVIDALASAVGLRRESAATVMSLAAPLVLGFLSRRVRDDDLDAAGLGNLLFSQRDALRAALPAGLSGALGLAGAPSGEPYPASRPVAPRTTARAEAPPRSAGGSRWVVPALAGAAALAALGFCTMSRDRAPDTTAAVDTAARAAGAAAVSAGEAVADAASGAAASLGAFVKRTLPGGVELNVPENGIESRLVAYVADASAPVTDTTWFDFDRLLFETGSATLKPESHEQLKNVAAVLVAYPKVKAKIGGYTDDTGDPAANQKLSEERASTVRQQLVALGVAADRLASEGYGEQHPVADNATEEGRAKNRRIAIRVTEK